jgi:hypothetical protein
MFKQHRMPQFAPAAFQILGATGDRQLHEGELGTALFILIGEVKSIKDRYQE